MSDLAQRIIFVRTLLFCLFVFLSFFINTTSYAKNCTDGKDFKGKEITAQSSSNLSKGLISAMTYDAKTELRVGDSGKAIQAYIDKGFLPQKPKLRADYVDYWVLNKPIDFMGHKLLLIEDEYMDQYVGCCVNTGVGISVEIKTALTKLKKFAKENKCSFKVYNQAEFNESLWVFNAADKLGKQKEKYVTVSCRYTLY